MLTVKYISRNNLLTINNYILLFNKMFNKVRFEITSLEILITTSN